MAEKNIEMAHYAISLLNAHDVDNYVQLFDESYVGESELAQGPIRGHAGVRQQLNMLFSAFPDVRIEIEETISSGDMIVSRARATGTHKGSFAGIAPTHKIVNWGACNVIEIRNGKVIRGRLYADYASLFQQLGALSLPRTAAAG